MRVALFVVQIVSGCVQVLTWQFVAACIASGNSYCASPGAEIGCTALVIVLPPLEQFSLLYDIVRLCYHHTHPHPVLDKWPAVTGPGTVKDELSSIHVLASAHLREMQYRCSTFQRNAQIVLESRRQPVSS